MQPPDHRRAASKPPLGWRAAAVTPAAHAALAAPFALAAFFALAAVAPPALAATSISDGDLGFAIPVGVAEAGKAPPAISFSASLPLRGVSLDVKRSDGRAFRLAVGNLAPGRERRVAVRQEKGSFEYRATVRGQGPDGPIEPFDLTFSLTVGAVPRIAIRADDVDLENGRLIVRVTEPKGHIALEVWDKHGAPLDEVDVAYDAPPGSPLTVAWKQRPGQVAGRFALKAYDIAEFWSGIESVTFVDIPHEDVVFESGKWDILPTEEAKLLAPLKQIAVEIGKVAGVLPISLYVAGYTDTVGQPADNVELSRKRAAAIAAWFRKKGLKVPILHQGFGEAVLAVPTPDGTDEARNRRAVYVLTSTTPPASAGFPGGGWRRL